MSLKGSPQPVVRRPAETPSGLEAYRGARVLVTGHTGFKGSWLSSWLIELGADTVGYALEPPTRPSLFECLGLASRMGDRRADVRDLECLSRCVAEVRPRVVFHLAAQALVRLSYACPAETFACNVMGVVNLLEAVRRLREPCAVVVVTSDKCYHQRANGGPFQEHDRLGGVDPYSASKAAAELAIEAYRQSFFPRAELSQHGVAVASARAGNVIGGGDWARDRIIPDLIRALLAEQPVFVRNPESTRPWQHVLDVLSGYLWLGARLLDEGAEELARAWNFAPAPGDALRVRDLVERILGAWGAGTWQSAEDRSGLSEADRLELSAGQAREHLGWTPTWGVDQTVDATVAWYRAQARGESMREFTSSQISEFSAAARAAGRSWAVTGS